VGFVMWAGFTIFALLLLYFPVAYLIMRLVRRSSCNSLRRAERTVCLTFDDGPDPAATPEILEALRTRGVRATFFVLGKKVEKYPELASSIAYGGHLIGEHGYSHLHPWKSNPVGYWDDLVRVKRTLERVLGPGIWRYYRPTYGKANAATLLFALLFRKVLVFWNVDPHDYRERQTTEIVRRVLDGVHDAQGAAVVLLHDGRTSAGSLSAAATTAAIGPICDQLAREGYQMLTLNELGRILGREKR
jgi:peptidoglycan-N-acetylglucosamine deacetylase